MDDLSLWPLLQEWSPYIVAALAVSTPLAHALQRAAHSLEGWAASTAAIWDDVALQRAVLVIDVIVLVLDGAGRVLPRVGVGRTPPAPKGSAKTVVILALALASSLPMQACGSAQSTQHERLNLMTDIADPTYAMAVDTCDALRDGIITREGTTYQQDRAAMDEVQEVCDPLVAGFETLRGTQLTARATIDGGLGSAATESITQALALWARLQALIPQLSRLGGAR